MIKKLILLFFLIIVPLVLVNCSKLNESTEQTSSSCAATECHPSTPLEKSVPVTGKHDQHLAVGYDCSKCHYNYIDNKYHKNGVKDAKGNRTIVIFDSQNPSGKWKNSTTTCENMSCHSSADWYGSSPSFTCTVCHASGKTTGAVDPVTTNGTGTSGKHDKHVSEKGIPCEECHNGYKAGADHANGTLDTGNPAVILTLFDSTNPAGIWGSDSGPGTGNCSSLACHGPSTLDWYGSGTWTLPSCSVCHKSAIGSRRQVFDSNGDGTGTGGDFNRKSHHVVDYSDSSVQLVQDSDCLVCHGQGSHMSGTVRLNDKDNAGQEFVYDPANASSLEPFCLSCHDSNGAFTEASPLSPFTSTNTLGSYPNIKGAKILENWNKTYGHGTNGDHSPADRLTCIGTGEVGTGCHGSNGAVNAHGSVNEIISTKAYYYSSATGDGTYNAAWYALCFDCHSSYAGITKEDTLGVKEGGILDNEAWLINCTSCHWSYNPTAGAFPPYYTANVTTHFADHDEAGDPFGLNDGLNPYMGTMPASSNLHWLHLGMFFTVDKDTNWNLVSCTNCHGVHGSNTPYGAVHDEMGYTNVIDGNGNTYGKMKDEAYDDSDGTPNYLGGYPTYCTMSCHEVTGPTRAWFSPIAE